MWNQCSEFNTDGRVGIFLHETNPSPAILVAPVRERERERESTSPRRRFSTPSITVVGWKQTTPVERKKERKKEKKTPEKFGKIVWNLPPSANIDHVLNHRKEGPFPPQSSSHDGHRYTVFHYRRVYGKRRRFSVRRSRRVRSHQRGFNGPLRRQNATDRLAPPRQALLSFCLFILCRSCPYWNVIFCHFAFFIVAVWAHLHSKVAPQACSRLTVLSLFVTRLVRQTVHISWNAICHTEQYSRNTPRCRGT